MIRTEKLVLGELQTNCYLVWDETTREAMVIDPADDGVGISEIIESKQLILKYVAMTHGHFDHVLGALDLKLIYTVPFCGNKLDQFLLDRQKETAKYFLGHKIQVPNFKTIDIDLEDVGVINLGEEIVEIIKTPGHTPGSVSFYYQPDGWVISGDVIFEERVGRTETKYSSEKELKKSILKLKALGKVRVLPGHGGEFII